MGKTTGIEYADSTVNEVMGCSGCELYHDEPGKNHCFAATLCRRWAGSKGYPADFSRPEIFAGRIERAARWSDLTGTNRPDKPWLDGMPRVVFVNDLGDGFCPTVDPDEWLTPVLPVMAAAPHIWLLLTKWPARMAEYFEVHNCPGNVWPGTSVTNQATAKARVLELLRIKAPVLWVSVEPMLGPIDFDRVILHCLTGYCGHPCDEYLQFGSCACSKGRPPNHRVGFVVTGGETGPGARPLDPAWPRALRDQCQAAGVAFFYKRGLLDGREWRQYPEVRHDHPH